MYELVFICFLCVAGVAFLLRRTRAEAIHVHSAEDLAGKTRPVDLEAVRNLLDPEQVEFLKSNLSRSQQRSLHRMRILAVADYVRSMAHNARVLVRFGMVARQHQDPKIAAAAQDLVLRAGEARVLAMTSLAKLYLEWIAPGVMASGDRAFKQYLRLTESASLLIRLQQPAQASRVMALL